MEDFKKEDGGKFTSSGRKLRPRKNSTSLTHHAEPAYSSSYGDRRPYSERPAYQHRDNGEDRPARPYAERRPYGEHHGYPDRRQDGEHRPYGERRQGGEHRPYGNNRQEGEHRPYGERRSFGERREGEGYRGGQQGERRPFGERKSYGHRNGQGDRPSYQNRGGRPSNRGGYKDGTRAPKRKYAVFTKSSEEGINRMISRRPQLDSAHIAEGAQVPVPNLEEIRLNKFIANSGVCSRREADTLIQAGVVTVNGVVVTELGTKVNAFTDDIRFNGERLKGESKVYIVMNKPKGYVTTAADPHAEKTVMDLLKGCTARVYPVGRLDKATTGVLMFTNDGELAERLTHPSYDKKKIYQVILDKELKQEDCEKILEGVTLSDGFEKADSLEYIDEEDHRKLGIEIHSGKNRVVRRLFEAAGYEVRALDRVYFAGLTKHGLKKGEWRYLSESEANILRMGAYV